MTALNDLNALQASIAEAVLGQDGRTLALMCSKGIV
mgnify:CR=1 FL=1